MVCADLPGREDARTDQAQGGWSVGWLGGLRADWVVCGLAGWSVLTYQAERMPEQIRLKVGGLWTNWVFCVQVGWSVD